MIGTLTHSGIRTETAAATFYLASGITQASIGLPMAIDPTADFTVKIAGDGDQVIGYLESHEYHADTNTRLGAVSWHLCTTFTYEGAAPTRGQGILGSVTSGTVKAAGATVVTHNIVTAVDTTNSTVEVLFR
jgi:hypothetical protein